MPRILFVVNALMTFPFGVAALVAPAALFATFGLELDTAGALIARGYGAALVAFGLVLWLSRNVTEAASVRAFLLSMAVFNIIEAAIQGVAGARGIAATIIFGNVAVHSAVALLCLYALMRVTPAVGSSGGTAP